MIALPELAEGLTWGIFYQPSAVSLEVLFAGDFSANRSVGGEDLVLFESGFGSTSAEHSDGDADGDDDADGADFLLWQQQFGYAAPTGEVVQIPESSAEFLALMAAAFMLTCKPTRGR